MINYFSFTANMQRVLPAGWIRRYIRKLTVPRNESIRILAI